jgi:hypothetical protein
MESLDAYNDQYITVEIATLLIQQSQITTPQDQLILLKDIRQHNRDIQKRENQQRDKSQAALKALNACQRCLKEPINTSNNYVIVSPDEKDDMSEVIMSLEMAYEQDLSSLDAFLASIFNNPGFDINRLFSCLLIKINEAASLNDTCPDPYYAQELKKMQMILERGLEIRKAKEGVSR